MDTKLGEISRHFFICPFCKGYANLDTHKCVCGAEVVEIRWKHESPELALISTKDA